MVDNRARRGEKQDLVVLPLDPRILDVDLRAAKAADLVVRLRERREGVVHDDLAHLNGIRALVADVKLDLAGRQDGPLHGELLLRHADAVEAGRVEQHEQPDGHREHGEWREARKPGRPPGGAGGGRLHQSSTWKKPIQPSSANSLTWAWNM